MRSCVRWGPFLYVVLIAARAGAADEVKVVDGDTVKVPNMDASLRLLGIDTEETFKHDKERQAYARGWDEYLKEQRGDSPHPVKMATPLGEDAKVFAQEFFRGVTKVKLEQDDPEEVRDYYDRYLAYVLVEKDGTWKNYNIEAVRAGMSPYFTKYGYSRRFHKEFVAAEAEARKAKRGIWDPSKQHYPDYDERKVWWDRRADFIQKFETDAAGHDEYVELTHAHALDALEARVGQKVVVLGAVDDIREGRPTIVHLSRKKAHGFPVVFFDAKVFARSGIAAQRGEYVRVVGKVSKYKGELQIVVDDPAQIVAGDATSGSDRREPPRHHAADDRHAPSDPE
jgi:endonuclease YncB( thermonuclease family)